MRQEKNKGRGAWDSVGVPRLLKIDLWGERAQERGAGVGAGSALRDLARERAENKISGRERKQQSKSLVNRTEHAYVCMNGVDCVYLSISGLFVLAPGWRCVRW